MRAYIVQAEHVYHNLELIAKKAGTAQVFAVLKGDGYGLGLNTMAELCRNKGITRFAVTEPADVRRLRLTGEEGEEILMLRPAATEEEVRQLLEEAAILTIGSQHDALLVSGVARDLGYKAKVHLKIDTGMGRYGFLPQELSEILACYKYLDCMEICGIFTHFHSAFLSKKKTKKQAEAFARVVQAIRDAGQQVGTVHCCNSSALFRNPEYSYDAVRVGSAILGRLAFRTPLKKVGYCQCSVDELRWLPKGHTTGYGGAWKARKTTRIAVLPVGWYHGFSTYYGDDVFRIRDCVRKVLSGLKSLVLPRRLTVKVGKETCRVLGHVGMLHTVIDVTDKHVSEGDIAVLEINPCRVRGMEIRFE